MKTLTNTITIILILILCNQTANAQTVKPIYVISGKERIELTTSKQDTLRKYAPKSILKALETFKSGGTIRNTDLGDNIVKILKNHK